jgi:hypothetical protein
MKRGLAAALVCAGTMLSAIASGKEPTTLEIEPWPAERECEACVPIQFSTLEMHLPLAEIGKIFVITLGSEAAMHLVPKSGQITEGLVLVEVPLEKGTKRRGFSAELKQLGITTNEQFFDRLGKAANGNKTLNALRRVYDIDTAARYTKASKNGLHVYWVRPDETIDPRAAQRNAIYFVSEGSDTAYLLGGPITRAFYETLLSNLRVTKIP